MLLFHFDATLTTDFHCNYQNSFNEINIMETIQIIF